jgi:hypothetical protein
MNGTRCFADIVSWEADMSAWSVGAGTASVRPALRVGVAEAETATDRVAASDAPTVDALIAWIPGEVIAAYMALVLALQGTDNTGGVAKPTAFGWLIAAIIAAGLLTFLGGFAKSTDLTHNQWVELGVKVVLSALAFALWSLVLPGSWWQSISTIADNAPVVAIVAGLAAAAFGFLAQGIVQRLPN